ncbi:MAG: hypothetical protein QOG71_3866 [Pyrinomonadaceae bacterium]|nr:hypothetical protein [Pyrinomonadaceae bacterium]
MKTLTAILALAFLIPLVGSSLETRSGEHLFFIYGTPYVIRNWFGVSKLPKIPSFEQKTSVVIFMDELDLEETTFSRWGTKTKDLVIIAAKVRLGENASFSHGSYAGSLEAGRLVIITQLLEVKKSGRLTFYGATEAPQTGVTSDNYTGGMGSSFELYAERVDVGQERPDAVIKDALVEYRRILQTKLGQPASSSLAALADIARYIESEEQAKRLRAIVQSRTTYDATLIDTLTEIRQAELLKKQAVEPLSGLIGIQEGFGIWPSIPVSIGFSTQHSVIAVQRPEAYKNFTTGPLFRPGAEWVSSKAYEYLKIVNSPEALQTLPDELQQLFSKWNVERLRYLEEQVSAAQASENLPELTLLFRKIESFPRYNLEAGDRQPYATLMTSLLKRRQEISGWLRSRQITVSVDGVGRTVEVFSEGLGKEYWIAPSDLLVRAINIRGKEYVGYVTRNQQDPNEIRLSLTAELRTDPWLFKEVERQIMAEGGRASVDLQRNIELTAVPPSGEGVIESTARIDGNLLFITMKLERERGYLALVRLAEAGLPVRLRWTYIKNRGITGELTPVVVTLSRRASASLLLTDGKLKNTSTSALTLHYVTLKNGSFRRLNQPKTLEPGTEIRLVELNVDPSEFGSITGEAIQYDVAPDTVLEKFLVLEVSSILQDITVTNHLPAADEVRARFLNLVEVKITRIDVNDQELESLENLKLSPANASGSSVRMTVKRAMNGSLRFRVTGMAIYTNGSQKLKERIVEGSTIDITDDWLP